MKEGASSERANGEKPVPDFATLYEDQRARAANVRRSAEQRTWEADSAEDALAWLLCEVYWKASVAWKVNTERGVEGRMMQRSFFRGHARSDWRPEPGLLRPRGEALRARAAQALLHQSSTYSSKCFKKPTARRLRHRLLRGQAMRLLNIMGSTPRSWIGPLYRASPFISLRAGKLVGVRRGPLFCGCTRAMRPSWVLRSCSRPSMLIDCIGSAASSRNSPQNSCTKSSNECTRSPFPHSLANPRYGPLTARRLKPKYFRQNPGLSG